MKKISILLIVSVLLIAIGASNVGAQPPSYTTCFQVQNLDSGSAATISMAYYEQGNATPVANPSDTIAAGGSNTYCPLSAVSSGFNGSMVISSNVAVSAIANVSADAGFSAYNASYTGFTDGATTVNLPLLFAGHFGYNTWFNVQNTGSSDATVNVSYSDGTTGGPVTIGAGQSHTFNQANETHTQTLLAGTITSDEPVVATVMEVGPNNQPMLFGYNGFTSGSTNPVMPLVQSNNFGFTTGIQVQNTGGTATNVTISYTPSQSGTACTEQKSIAPGASETFGLTGSCIWTQTTFVGSAEVTGNSASQDLVAIVNQQNFGTFKGASYGAFNVADATSTVVMPLIMDLNFGYFTGFNVANVGGDSTTVNCSFSGSAVTVNDTLAAGEAMTAVQFNVLPAGYVGSATCTASGGTDNAIISVVNQSKTTGTQDTFLTYEATNN